MQNYEEKLRLQNELGFFKSVIDVGNYSLPHWFDSLRCLLINSLLRILK